MFGYNRADRTTGTNAAKEKKGQKHLKHMRGKKGDASDARMCVTTTTPLSLVQSNNNKNTYNINIYIMY